MLDADQLVFRRLDDLFMYRMTEGKPFMAPAASWSSPDTIASNLLLVAPSTDLFSTIQKELEGIKPEYDTAFLNRLFSANITRLPGSYVVLNSIFEKNNPPTWVDRNSPMNETLWRLYRHNTHIMHFSVVQKPWISKSLPPEVNKTAPHSTFKRGFDIWWELKEMVLSGEGERWV